MAPDEDTSRLKVEQGQRERAEQRLAEQSMEADEAAQHERRADKAAYLRARLEERERSERALEED